MCYLNPQEEIKDIMLKQGITYSWIADRLGTYYQKIEYAIKVQKELPMSMYTAIMNLFEKHGYISSSKEICSNISQLTIRVNSQFNESLRRLNDEVAADAQDEHYQPEERLRLRYKIEEIRNDMNKQLDELLRRTDAAL